MIGVQLYCGDNFKILPKLNCKVDAIITDPPYGIGGDVVRSSDKRVEKLPDWDRFSMDWLSLCLPILSENATIAFFMDGKYMSKVLKAFKKCGLKYQQTIYWMKHARPPNPRKGFQSSIETIVYARKGKAVWNGGGLTENVWFGNIEKRKRFHPTEKPCDLMEWLVNLLTDTGQTVLDPFMGSGTTGVVCKRLGRKFIGIEQDTKYFTTADRRIKVASFVSCEKGKWC